MEPSKAPKSAAIKPSHDELAQQKQKEGGFIPQRLEMEWYDLDAACRVKGINKKTAQNQTWLQPRGGHTDAIIGRKKRWHWTTIQQWLVQFDDELLESIE